MGVFSQEITEFLKNLAGKDEEGQQRPVADITQPIGHSLASTKVGSVIVFSYANMTKVEWSDNIAMVWKPPAYTSGKKNILLPCVKIDPTSTFTLGDIKELYKNRNSLPSESYRTYKWKTMFQIHKVVL